MKIRFSALLCIFPLGLSAQPNLGAPLQGITTAMRAVFDAGKQDFGTIEEIKDGLGPAYNGVSCGACHNIPVLGGGGNATVLRAGRRAGNIYTEPTGGSLIHQFATDPKCQPLVPANANVQARRLATPLFGAGLLEAIPDTTLRAIETQQRQHPDRIAGRAAIVRDPVSNTTRVGRFGWKSQQATLLAFAGDAYVNEMGITNDIFPNETGSGLSQQQLAACDPNPAIEDQRDSVTQLRGIDLFENFMKFLAPPDRLPVTPEIANGERLFATVGCAGCHVPSIPTGPNPNPVFANKAVRAYSDLLLHSIDTGDRIDQADAKGDEIRTAPLWGLRFRKLLLHDGSALSIDAAVQAHGGQANPARTRYRALSVADRNALTAFLNSL